ncbi:MAG: WhiB family transcriptional regulator, partial [Ilumatobacteraceae bacterium]
MTILASSVALAAADDQWRDQALCRDTDPDLFFPVGTTGMALVQIEHAKRVCGQCTVAAECLEFALATNQDSGIWGGLSE